MELSKFRRLFQDLPEGRNTLIRCLSGASLIALRSAVGFWLSDREKRAHLSLLWDVFEHMKWCEDTGGATMMGQALTSAKPKDSYESLLPHTGKRCSLSSS